MQRTGVEKLLEEVQLGSASWLGDEMMSALSSEDMQGETELDDDDDSDLDDVSSLSFSDVSHLRASSSKRAAAVAERTLEVLAAQRDNTLLSQTEFEEFKREKKKEVSDLRSQLHQLQHDNDMLKMKLDYLNRRYEAERQEVEERHLVPARARIAALETEAARAKEGLEVSKQKMSSALQISRAEYEALSCTPEAERSVSQHLSVLVWEMLEEGRRGRETARREADALRQSLEVTQSERADLQSEWDRLQQAAAERQTEQSKALAQVAARSSALQQEVDKLTSSLSLHEARSKRCEEAEEQWRVSKAERAGAVAERDQARVDLTRMQEDKQQALHRAEEREREAEMLRLDKDFIARQLAELTAKCERAEQKLEKKTLKLKDAQRAKEQLEGQLLQQQALSAATHEDRVQAELASLRQRADQEMMDIKKSTAELYQRQNRMLSDAREEAQGELDRLRTRLIEVEKARDLAVREHMELATSVEGKMSEAKSVAKIKTMELERLLVAHEDLQTLNRQLKLEADMYRDKLELIRTELSSLQSSSNTRIAQLEADIRHTTSRLSTFEAIESNLSLAISDVGGFEQGGNLELESHVVALGSGAPTDATRRMAQTMALARKGSRSRKKLEALRRALEVIAQQKELDALRNALEATQREVERLQHALADANKLLDSTSQPHELLVSAVRGRDEELRAMRAEGERLQSVLAAVQAERDRLREQCSHLKRDIEQVVEKRHATETLQSAVTQLQAQQQVKLMRLNQARNQQGLEGVPTAAYLDWTVGGAGEGSWAQQTGLVGTLGGGGGGAQLPQPQALWFQKLRAKAT